MAGDGKKKGLQVFIEYIWPFESAKKARVLVTVKDGRNEGGKADARLVHFLVNGEEHAESPKEIDEETGQAIFDCEVAVGKYLFKAVDGPSRFEKSSTLCIPEKKETPKGNKLEVFCEGHWGHYQIRVSVKSPDGKLVPHSRVTLADRFREPSIEELVFSEGTKTFDFDFPESQRKITFSIGLGREELSEKKVLYLLGPRKINCKEKKLTEIDEMCLRHPECLTFLETKERS
ncbi:hypothetical protein HYT01_03665 [Candidatus Giovannonibacteria bacterium]|nr:hypothetical protein [Candidatus Giovannonibacteria bacterium]